MQSGIYGDFDGINQDEEMKLDEKQIILFVLYIILGWYFFFCFIFIYHSNNDDR